MKISNEQKSSEIIEFELNVKNFHTFLLIVSKFMFEI
jgi:hypothetical protein